MDDKRFDDLSRRLAVPLTRAGFFRSLSAVGGAALAAITGLNLAEAKKGKGGGKKGKGGGKKDHGGKKGKKKDNSDRQGDGPSAQNDSPVTALATCGANSISLCHCAPPDDPNGNCFVECPNGSGVACAGHGNGPNAHTADCICGGPAIDCPGPPLYTIPACPPDRCGANAEQNAQCSTGSICAGECTTTDPECPGIVDCRCVIDEGQTEGVCETNQICEGVCNDTDLLCPDVTDCECVIAPEANFGTCETPVTCEGACTDQEDCTSLGVTDCVCHTLAVEPFCGACIPNGEPAGSSEECCSGDFCEATGLCGDCVCQADCDNQNDCTGLGVEGCVCLGIGVEEQPTCGPCVEDNQPANNAGECCGNDFCPNQGGVGGVCAECPPAPTPPTPAQLATCPPGFTGNAKSPCNGTCPCSKGRTCKNGRCCEKKGTHCGTGKECCSGKCKRTHDNHKQCG